MSLLTGVRNYIHVLDLADGHIAAMIRAFEQASGKKIPYRITNRRAGDIAACWVDAGLAKKLLNWEAKHTLEKTCADVWRWQEMNPDGFVSSPDQKQKIYEVNFFASL